MSRAWWLMPRHLANLRSRLRSRAKQRASIKLLPALKLLSFVSLTICCGAWAAAQPGTPRARDQSSLARGVARERARIEAASSRRAARLGLGTLKSAAKLLAGRAEQAWVRAAGPDRWTGALRLPISQGHTTRGFGSGAGGYHQAVDLAAELGTAVHTAAPGIVGYAGSEVSGYGNLVIVVHPSAFITVYAHNQRNLVVAGQRVGRGALVARLGSTGLSMGPHLHFELLWNGQNCDPMQLFRPGPRRKNGVPSAPASSVWKDPNKKPKAIRCAARKHHPDYAARGAPQPHGDRGDDAPADELQ